MNQTGGINSRQITIKVNETSYSTATNQTGWYSLSLNLQPINNNATTYTVTASFEDTDTQPLTATAWAYTLDGQQYAACTTVQYGYKPAYNTTTLTISTQSTKVLATTMSPEEMQEEAERQGWFRVDPEFSWCYPWCRLHYKLDVNLPQGNPKIDYGWSLLPFGESYTANSTALANDATKDNDPYALLDLIVPVLLQFGAALVLGCTPISAAIAIASYAVYSGIRACQLYLTSANNPKAWLTSFIASLIAATCGLAIMGASSSLKAVYSILTSTSRFVLGEIESIWHSMIAKSFGFFAIVGAAFALIDFAFMAFYLTMYLSSI